MSIENAFQTALEHHQAGRLPEAEAMYRQILQIVPNHRDALYFRGMLAHQVGRNDVAVDLINQVISTNPSNPNYYNQLGIVFKAQGKLDEAIACYRKALSISPDYAEAHNNLGNALADQGKLDDAVVSYRKALSVRPDYSEAHCNLGTVLQDQGKLDEAAASYSEALSFRPDFAGAHYNLGNTLKSQGNLEGAIGSYRNALTFKSDFAEAHDGLGIALLDQGRPEEAAASCRRALSFKPEYAAAHNNLGNALNELGQVNAALASYRSALKLEDAPEFRANFARCMGGMDSIQIDADLRHLVTRAMSEPWARPTVLAKTVARLLMSDRNMSPLVERALNAWPARLRSQDLLGASGLNTLADDPLLRSLLESAPVGEIVLERFLIMVRHTLVDAAIDAGVDGDPEDKTLTFYCAIARQCFINEFIFAYTDEEFDRVSLLREKLVAALGSGNAIPVLWVVTIAAYFPLSSLPSVETLLDQSWPVAVAALLVQQITEPLQEQKYRDAIPRLTTIEDGVSRLVQQQYEENPYPRWTKSAPGNAVSIDAHLRRQFPFAPFRALNKGRNINILVAGCGTGQESIDTARQFSDAQVLAVDLSLSSLCYARRKTHELGLGNIEYAQGDILKIGSVGRMFDAILSVGVLHHLEDPMAGWRELLSVLRPGGVMRLGLYSERARRTVVAARGFITEQQYLPNAAGIRRCRQELMDLKDGRDFRQLTGFSDFFVTSECRDLLFHVQEQRFALPQIKEMLARLDLDFIGFSLEPRVTKQYRERFPDDKARTNLDYWSDFESSFPNTFLSMYQFWVQKTG